MQNSNDKNPMQEHIEHALEFLGAHALACLINIVSLCSMWKRAMRAMDVGVEAAASPQCMVPLQARLELVNAIGQLNVSATAMSQQKH